MVVQCLSRYEGGWDSEDLDLVSENAMFVLLTSVLQWIFGLFILGLLS